MALEDFAHSAVDRRAAIAAIVVPAILAAMPRAAAAQSRELPFLSSPRSLSSGQSSRIAYFARNFPSIKHGVSGDEYFIVTSRNCPFARKLHSEFPTPPDGLIFRYIVLPIRGEDRNATKNLYCFPTLENFSSYMNFSDSINYPVIEKIGIAVQNTVLEGIGIVGDISFGTPSIIKIVDGYAKMWTGYGGGATPQGSIG